MAERIGIDLGGTKIELVVLAADGSVRWRRRVATPQGDYAGTLHAIVALILLRSKANNAFKPKLHRYAVNMAERACHVASYALQFGLT